MENKIENKKTEYFKIDSVSDYVRWTQTTAVYLDKVRQHVNEEFFGKGVSTEEIEEEIEETNTNYERLGLLGEVGEIAQLLKRHIRDGKPMDKEEMKLELGDIAWYMARCHYNHTQERQKGDKLKELSNLFEVPFPLGSTCMEEVYLIMQAKKSIICSPSKLAKFAFGECPDSVVGMIQQLASGLDKIQEKTEIKFILGVQRRVLTTPVTGLLEHIIANAHSEESIITFFALCWKYDFEILDVLQTNVNKLESRKERGKLHGEGSNR